MSNKLLTAAALVALSVSDLERALEPGEYASDTLTEALGLEKAKDEPRKTAIEALENALEDAPAEQVESKGPVVSKGRAITSKKGILSEGKPVRPEDLSGGEAAFKALQEKGFIG